MFTSVYSYPWDIADESVERFLETVQQRLGTDTISVAVSYHAAKLLLPHNPRRAIYYPDDGTVYFRPDPAAFRGQPIQPILSELTQQEDVVRMLCDSAPASNMKVIAWLVCLHNTRLGSLYPQFSPRSAFGDPVMTYLCPAHPEVRRYIATLAATVARQHDIMAVQLEAAHYMPYDHGFHHEMSQMTLDNRARFLLGLCFCAACSGRAREAGIDSDALRGNVITDLRTFFAADRLPDAASDALAMRRTAWPGHYGDDMARFLEVRTAIVTDLLRDIVGAVRAVSQASVLFQDASALLAGPITPAIDVAWQLGIDLPTIAGIADGVSALGYFSSVSRTGTELMAYRDVLGAATPLDISLRPAAPDCTSPADLAAKVAACRYIKAAGVSFYNYGMMPLRRMDWVRAALTHDTYSRTPEHTPDLQ